MAFKHISIALLFVIIIVRSGNATENSSQHEEKTVSTVTAGDNETKNNPKWGVGIGQRFARSPFSGEDKNVFDVIPVFYYEGERFYLRGLEGGVHLWNNDAFGFDFFIGYRFFDFPEDFDDILNRNTFDAGLRSYYKFAENAQVALNLMTDIDGRFSGTIQLEKEFSGNRWWLTPLLEIRAKSSDFNSLYYGLDVDELDAGR